MKIKKGLILYASIGNGHRTAAEAVYEELLKNKDIKPIMYDILKSSNIDLSQILNGINLKKGIGGKIYDFLWNQKSVASVTTQAIKIIYSNFQKLENVICEFSPDFIVSTHALGALLVNNFYKTKKIPIFSIITDSRVAPIWYLTRCDYYFLPNENCVLDAISHKSIFKNYLISGIPLKKDFYEKSVNKKTKTILFFLGGKNVISKYLNFENNFVDIIKIISEKYPIKVICGNNRKIFDLLKNTKSKKINIFGKVDKTANFIRNSTVIITKPGGLITAEAKHFKKPIIFYNSGFGQERGNEEYFINKGLAIKSAKVNDIPYIIDNVMDGKIYKLIQSNYQKEKNIKSTQIICNEIVKLIK